MHIERKAYHFGLIDNSYNGDNDWWKFWAIAHEDIFIPRGRFEATLSATASFNWSVPTYTSTNLIQRPVYETRRLSWTPVATAQGGSITSYTVNTASYILKMTQLIYNIDVVITAAGTGVGDLSLTLPFTFPIAATGSGRERAVTGKLAWMASTAGAASVSSAYYDNTTLIVTNSNLIATFSGVIL